MYFVLTSAGEAALAANPGSPPTLHSFKAGASFGYVPSIADTDIRGLPLHAGSPSSPVVQSSSLLKYTVHMDKDTGDFSFGEIGLYLPGGVLFALGASASPILKTRQQGVVSGNNLVIDCYVTTVGSNFAIFAEMGNSSSNLNVGSVNSVDSLPSAFNANPNVYVIPAPDGKGSVLAYSNNAAWSFTGYEEIADQQVLAASTSNSLSVGQPSVGPVFFGELLVQVMDGPATGAVRIVTGYSSAGQVFSVGTPFLTPPAPNNTIRILKKTQLRDHVSAILAGLSPDLTAGHLNDLVNHPLNGMVKRNGTTPMQAPFDSGGFRVINLPAPSLPTDAANKDYVDSQMGSNSAVLSSILAQLTTISNMYLRKDGAVPMTGNLNLGANRVINMASPINPSDGATKAYTDAAILAAVSAFPTVHNDMQGLQGGDGSSQFFHLSAAERSLVAQLTSQGFPIASYVTPGITRLSPVNETGSGTSINTAVTPDSLYSAISSPTTNALKDSIVELINSSTSPIQFGSGDPSVMTPAIPPLYADVSATTPVVWSRHAGVWKKVTGMVFRTGTADPTPLTPVQPPVYFNTSTLPWKMFMHSSGAWREFFTPYVQHGVGVPDGSTPVSPSVYIDTATDPYTMYTFYGGAWFPVSANLGGAFAHEFYFFGQFGF